MLPTLKGKLLFVIDSLPINIDGKQPGWGGTAQGRMVRTPPLCKHTHTHTHTHRKPTTQQCVLNSKCRSSPHMLTSLTGGRSPSNGLEERLGL